MYIMYLDMQWKNYQTPKHKLQLQYQVIIIQHCRLLLIFIHKQQLKWLNCHDMTMINEWSTWQSIQNGEFLRCHESWNCCISSVEYFLNHCLQSCFVIISTEWFTDQTHGMHNFANIHCKWLTQSNSLNHQCPITMSFQRQTCVRGDHLPMVDCSCRVGSTAQESPLQHLMLSARLRQSAASRWQFWKWQQHPPTHATVDYQSTSQPRYNQDSCTTTDTIDEVNFG